MAYVGTPISIHSLLAEGDLDLPHALDAVQIFQSTPSSRRETLHLLDAVTSAR